MPDPALLERALGAYLGLAVGDALGASVEFMTPAEIARVHGVHRRMIGGGWLSLAPGAVTDDTEMSLALGAAIIERGDFHLPSIAEAWVNWLRQGPVDCGDTCRRGIRRYMLEGTLEAPPNERDAGNGALMRNLPTVLCSFRSDAVLCERTLLQSRFTHNHAYSDAACVCLARVTACLLQTSDLSRARALCDALVQEHEVFAYEGYSGRATAYVVDTMRTVLACFWSHLDFESAVIAAVNRGDDADTTGALVGMLAGARFGAGAIPRPWLGRLDVGVRAKIEAQVPALLTQCAKLSP